ERTHAGPKQDRLDLLAATRADLGLLFMLVSDPEGELLRATAPEGEPIAEARDLQGELHRLWRITDEARVARVQKLMEPRPVFIADGHHRYETAVEYARRHHRVAPRDVARLARARGVDPPRGAPQAAPRDHRRQARRQDPCGLHGGSGGGDPPGARGRVPGRLPDRADHGGGAPDGGP